VLATEIVDVRKKGYTPPMGALPLYELELLLLNGSVFRSRLLGLSNSPQRGNKAGPPGLSSPRDSHHNDGYEAGNGDNANMISNKPGISSSGYNINHIKGGNSITPRIKTDKEADSNRDRSYMHIFTYI
jgi:hypothetical protein